MRNIGQIVAGSLRKSLSTSGRECRSDFWIFSALWVPLAILLVWVFAPLKEDIFRGAKIYLICAVLSVPLLSAAARRLQDTGEPGNIAFLPLAPLGILYSAFIGIPVLFLGSARVFFQAGTNSGDMVAFLSAVVGGFLGYAALKSYFAFFIIALIATLKFSSNIFGQALLASQPGPNTYGPNPNEVPL